MPEGGKIGARRGKKRSLWGDGAPLVDCTRLRMTRSLKNADGVEDPKRDTR